MPLPGATQYAQQLFAGPPVQGQVGRGGPQGNPRGGAGGAGYRPPTQNHAPHVGGPNIPNNPGQYLGPQNGNFPAGGFGQNWSGQFGQQQGKPGNLPYGGNGLFGNPYHGSQALMAGMFGQGGMGTPFGGMGNPMANLMQQYYSMLEQRAGLFGDPSGGAGTPVPDPSGLPGGPIGGDINPPPPVLSGQGNDYLAAIQDMIAGAAQPTQYQGTPQVAPGDQSILQNQGAMYDRNSGIGVGPDVIQSGGVNGPGGYSSQVGADGRTGTLADHQFGGLGGLGGGVMDFFSLPGWMGGPSSIWQQLTSHSPFINRG